MYIAILCTVGLAGAGLGLRFKVLVLVPAIMVVAVAAVAFALAVGVRGLVIVLPVVLAAASLQSGYLVGVTLSRRAHARKLFCVILGASFFHLMPPAGAEPSYIRTGEAELAPVWLVGFCVRKPIYCAPKTPQIVQVTPSRWNELVATNTAVNQSIQSTPDNSITRPAHDDANEGDCKDYALTKRSRLIDLGWPPGALLIATADVPSGERHAVLVVVTDKGDLVLDNLRYGIVPWAVLQYRWHSIMQPNNPQFWRRIISWLRVHPGALT